MTSCLWFWLWTILRIEISISEWYFIYNTAGRLVSNRDFFTLHFSQYTSTLAKFSLIYKNIPENIYALRM
jgi:hypothetical protein